MVEIDSVFKENVKISFKKAKEHNITIEKGINKLKSELKDKSEDLNLIKTSLNELKAFFTENKEYFNLFKFSTGNKGVLNNDKQQQTTTNNNKQCPTMINNDKQQPTETTNNFFLKHKFSDNFSERIKEKVSLSEKENQLNLSTLPEKSYESLTSLNEEDFTDEQSIKETLTSENLLKNSKDSSFISEQTPSSNKIDEPIVDFSLETQESQEQTLTSLNLDKKPQIYSPKTTTNTNKTLTSLLSGLKEELTKTLTSLTDREISTLLAIYDIESEGLDVSYSHLAQKLKLSENTIRVIIMSLLNKNAPVTKERYFNRKVFLSLNKEFKELNLLQKLLVIRNSNKDQKTLFDL